MGEGLVLVFRWSIVRADVHVMIYFEYITPWCADVTANCDSDMRCYTHLNLLV